MIGGTAMEYYGMRKAGADVEQINRLVRFMLVRFLRFHTGGTERLCGYTLNADNACCLQCPKHVSGKQTRRWTRWKHGCWTPGKARQRRPAGDYAVKTR